MTAPADGSTDIIRAKVRCLVRIRRSNVRERGSASVGRWPRTASCDHPDQPPSAHESPRARTSRPHRQEHLPYTERPNPSTSRTPRQRRPPSHPTHHQQRHADHNPDVRNIKYPRPNLPDSHIQEIENPAMLDAAIDQIAKSAAENARYCNDFDAAQPRRPQQPYEQAGQYRQNTIDENDVARRIGHVGPKTEEGAVVIGGKNQKTSGEKRHHLARRQYLLEERLRQLVDDNPGKRAN